MKKNNSNKSERDVRLYCVRKYVLAQSAREALKLEKTFDADDIVLEDTWKAERVRIGFKTE